MGNHGRSFLLPGLVRRQRFFLTFALSVSFAQPPREQSRPFLYSAGEECHIERSVD
jgi:hypothetical protein